MSDPSHWSPPGLIPLALPPRPPEPARPGFPWIASAAPVVGATAIWAVTGSTFALLFAVLGPLVAVASMLDGRRQSRRERRRSAGERRAALERLRQEIALRHDLEREAAWRLAPGARRVMERGIPAWRATAPGPVVLGAATLPSRVRIDGMPSDDADADLLRSAGRLTEVPLTAEVDGGLGFTGPRSLALAAARAALVQCADAVPPGTIAIEAPGTEAWQWIAGLPHVTVPARARLRVVDGAAAAASREADGDRVHLIAIGATPDELPPGLATVVELRHRGLAVVGRGTAIPVVPELAGTVEAGAWVERAAIAGRRAGMDGAAALPARVALSELDLAPAAGDRSSLRVPVGASESGPLHLDLATGPHALVAGTSGSGKSEFLVTWVAALAAIHPPDRVAFLLVDFKGGAAFDPVAALPHVTGVVTDLAESEAGRAVASIRAELRHREHVLASVGARDLANLGPDTVLPRLVVVIDEFQAMVERFPELGAVIADVAARGRSLGVHLILASQRPNGVVRENVTANCGIRVSLRVLQRADSTAVVGTEAAASIEASTPGRGIADAGDGRVVRFQSALADDAAIRSAADRHAAVALPRRPWLDPLPRSLTLGSVGAVLGPERPDPDAILLGVADDPDRQRRVPIEWRPASDGPLAVLGAPGSGRTALLAAIANQVAERRGPDGVLRIEGPRSAVWDALDELDRALADGRRLPALVVLDGLDSCFAAWPDEARFTGIARVESILRGVRDLRSAVVVSAARLTGLGAGVRDALGSTVLLRHPTRADLVQAGGDGTLWEPDAVPGSGQWHGLRAQFLAAPRPPAGTPRPPLPYEPARHPLTAVCSRTPRADAAAIAAACPEAEVVLLGDGPEAAARATSVLQHGPEPGSTRIVVGDADSWTTNWTLAAQARSRAAIVVHGGTGEYRALARDAAPPPLLDDHRRQCWVVPTEAPPERRSWIPRHD